MWLDSNNSKESIARHLGVDFNIVTQQARRLGLPARRNLRKGNLSSSKEKGDPSQYRYEWLRIMKENQGEGLTTLIRRVKQARRIYDWLMDHDREWLLSHRPPLKTSGYTKVHLSVDLRPSDTLSNKNKKEERDRLTSEAIRAVGERIMRAPGEPQRVTRAQIEKAVPEVAWLHFRWNAFPLTVQTFSEMRESREVFALRRIRWALQNCQEESIKPTRHEFILSAKVRRVLNIPAVQTAIEEALTILYKLD